MSDCLIIFSRYPEPGKTKTRLIPALGATQAAQLQRAMTERTLNIAQMLAPEVAIRRACHFVIAIHFAGGSTAQMQAWLGEELRYAPQQGGDLGQRMAASFQAAFAEGMKRVVIVGIDCPELTPALLQDAFRQLHRHDAVLGPAADGGYYLIGLQRLIPELFNGIEWGSDRVFQQTMVMAEQLQLSVASLPVLRDIDTPEDLAVWDALQ